MFLPVDVKRGSDLRGRIDLNLYRQGVRSLDFGMFIPEDFALGEAEVVVRGLSWSDESSQLSSSFLTDLDNYINDKMKELKSNGLIIEIRSKSESLPDDQQKSYFSETVSLPFVLEGSFTGSVMVLE